MKYKEILIISDNNTKLTNECDIDPPLGSKEFNCSNKAEWTLLPCVRYKYHSCPIRATIHRKLSLERTSSKWKSFLDYLHLHWRYNSYEVRLNNCNINFKTIFKHTHFLIFIALSIHSKKDFGFLILIINFSN